MAVITEHPRRLETAPPFEDLFPVDDQVLAQIVTSMRKDGYHKTKPIKAWQDAFATPGRLVVVDGHTRLAAARRARITEVMVDARHYTSAQDAYLDAIREQAARRNLPRDQVAVFAVRSIKALREQGGRQPTTKQLAAALNVSTATVDRARQILDRGGDDLIQRVLERGISLLDAYDEVRRADHPVHRYVDRIDEQAAPVEQRSRARGVQYERGPFAAGEDPVAGAAIRYRERAADHPNPEVYRALVETLMAAEDGRHGAEYELDVSAASELAFAMLHADRDLEDVLG